MIRTLERYVFRELLKTFLVALLGITFVFFLGTTFRLMMNDLSYVQLFSMLPYAVPYTLPYTLPMSLLIAVTLTYGRLVADREVLAFESSGVPPRALATPGIFLGVVLTLLSLFLQSTYLPICHQRVGQIDRAVLERLLELGEGGPFGQTFPGKSFDIYVKHHAGRNLTGVVIHQDLSSTQPVTLVAERGVVEPMVDADGVDRLVFTLTNVHSAVFSVSEGMRPGPPMLAFFPTCRVSYAMESGGKVKPMDYSNAQLRGLERKEIDARRFGGSAGFLGAALVAADDRLDSIPFELASRAGLALAPIVFMALGYQVTFAVRASNRLIPFVLGVGAVSAFFFAPMLVGRTLCDRQGAWPGWSFLGDMTGMGAALLMAPIRWSLRR